MKERVLRFRYARLYSRLEKSLGYSALTKVAICGETLTDDLRQHARMTAQVLSTQSRLHCVQEQDQCCTRCTVLYRMAASITVPNFRISAYTLHAIN